MPSRSNRAAEVTTDEGEVLADVIEMDGYVLETKTIWHRGKAYRFRELTLGENDACRDAATSPDDKYDGMEMMRQMIALSSVEPSLTRDDLNKVPARLYAHMVEAVNDLNDPDTLKVDPGNS